MKIIRRDFKVQNDGGCWQLDPVLQRIFINRGIHSEKELVYSLNGILLPNFLGIDKAAEIIASAMWKKNKIRIVGDYDADGATGTAEILRFLNESGYSDFDYYIPDRSIEGYGLSTVIVEQAAKDKVDLIITVDNGISAVEAAYKAKELGIDLIITDHHEPGSELPIATVVVDPKQPGCPFPSKNVSGVGVAFYVMTKVCAVLEKSGWYKKLNIKLPVMSRYLDLVAIGTVADVVVMDYNNRLMVQYGIKLIRSGMTSKGILELIRISGCHPNGFTSQDIAFSVGPRLNSAGRIDNMRNGVKCLMSDTEYEAKCSAHLLYLFNQERRDIEKKMELEAETIISSEYHGDTDRGIVLYSPSFHPGVMGNLSSKLREKYNIPVIVFTDTHDQKRYVGSGRSVPGLNLHDVFASIYEQRPEMFKAFGGHAMAAGITINKEYFGDFKQLFYDAVYSRFNGKVPEEEILTDGILPSSYFISSFARALVFDQPWGTAFPSPLFDGEFLLVSQKIVHDHMRLRLKLDSGLFISAMYFFYDKIHWPNDLAKRVRVVYCFDSCCNKDTSSFSLIVRKMESI